MTEAREPGALGEAARRAFPLLSKVARRGFLVGGTLRDLILGRASRDADVAIDGAAEEARRFAAACGGRIVMLGAAPFDVVRVAAGGAVYDFAEIVGASIEEDLGRRDFTIGAMALALDASRRVVDPFGGVADLDGRMLRMVRESNFADDPLRVLRGARLVAELGLSVDDATLEAMRRHASEIESVARERLGTEWLTLLEAEDAGALRRGLELVCELGLDRILAGGLLRREAVERAARIVEADPITRLAAMACDDGESPLCDAAQRLGLGGSRVDAIVRACRVVRHVVGGATTVDPVVLHDEGEDAAIRAVAIARAAGHADAAERLAAVVAADGAGIFGARPLLDGHAIGAITGLAPGPRVGAIRRALLIAQLRRTVTNEGEAREFVERQVARL